MARRKSRQLQTTDPRDYQHARTRLYVRESSDDQVGPDHYGPDLQRAGTTEYCERHQIPLPQFEYFDAASARSMRGRTALQQAIDDGVRGDYDVLLVFHSSRSFRNSHDAKVAKRKLGEAGLTLIFTAQNLISGDPNRKIEEGLYELMDEQRSDEQAMFVRAGLRQKHERSLHNGSVPLGYERIHAAPSDPQNKQLEVAESEARTVRLIFEMYATGRCSQLEIALALNAAVDAEGNPAHRTKRGRPFTEGGVREILGNRVYTGVVVWHPYTVEEEVRPGRHQPIIDPRPLRARPTGQA